MRDPSALLADDLDQDPLGPPTVELAVEDPLPGAEVQLALGDRHGHVAAHDLTLVMGVAIVLTGAVVVIDLRRGIERRQTLQPAGVVLVQARFIVVDEDAGGYVRCSNLGYCEPVAIRREHCCGTISLLDDKWFVYKHSHILEAF